MPDAQALSDETLAVLVEETDAGKRRLIVLAADRASAKAWAKHRRVRKWYWAEDSKLLFDLNADTEAIVLVKGYRSHPQWHRIGKRLQVVGATVPIYRDELPADAEPPAPTIGGAYVLARGIQQVRPEKDQGDTFILSASGATITLTRAHVEAIVDLMGGFLEGEPVADPALERFEEIRALIERTGDLYGREAS